jgi:hypothetical protein
MSFEVTARLTGGLDLDRDGHLVGRDLRLALGEIRDRLGRVLRADRVERATHRTVDLLTSGVVGVAGVEVVDVGGRKHRQLAALLAGGRIRRTAAGGLGGGLRRR